MVLGQATHLSGVRKPQFLLIQHLQIPPASAVALKEALNLGFGPSALLQHQGVWRGWFSHGTCYAFFLHVLSTAEVNKVTRNWAESP